jgi:hypothetical protein
MSTASTEATCGDDAMAMACEPQPATYITRTQGLIASSLLAVGSTCAARRLPARMFSTSTSTRASSLWLPNAKRTGGSACAGDSPSSPAARAVDCGALRCAGPDESALGCAILRPRVLCHTAHIYVVAKHDKDFARVAARHKGPKLRGWAPKYGVMRQLRFCVGLDDATVTVTDSVSAADGQAVAKSAIGAAFRIAATSQPTSRAASSSYDVVKRVRNNVAPVIHVAQPRAAVDSGHSPPESGSRCHVMLDAA